MRLQQSVERGQQIMQSPDRWQVKPPAPPRFHHTPPVVFSDSPSSFLMSPLPPIMVSPDNLRQFHRNGYIPQVRTLTPAPL